MRVNDPKNQEVFLNTEQLILGIPLDQHLKGILNVSNIIDVDISGEM